MRRGRRFQSWQAAADHFEQDLRTDSTLSLRTVTFYKETAHVVLRFMESEGLHTLPHQIVKDDLIKLLDAMERKKLAIATRKGYLSALNKYLLHFGNSCLQSLKYKFPADCYLTLTRRPYSRLFSTASCASACAAWKSFVSAPSTSMTIVRISTYSAKVPRAESLAASRTIRGRGKSCSSR